ncbi:MAG: hypothetical protein DYG85_11230 [Chloroflexi bacterium CFX1]|nr:hypothetical protein [Chloroflexi bacterium CFX1]MCQ3951958.1 hypothetical protein [Chloroflexota bacterium]
MAGDGAIVSVIPGVGVKFDSLAGVSDGTTSEASVAETVGIRVGVEFNLVFHQFLIGSYVTRSVTSVPISVMIAAITAGSTFCPFFLFLFDTTSSCMFYLVKSLYKFRRLKSSGAVMVRAAARLGASAYPKTTGR